MGPRIKEARGEVRALTKRDIVRAWKDEEYREKLSEEERAQLPGNPAGVVELPDSDLAAVGGGIRYSDPRFSNPSKCCR